MKPGLSHRWRYIFNQRGIGADNDRFEILGRKKKVRLLGLGKRTKGFLGGFGHIHAALCVRVHAHVIELSGCLLPGPCFYPALSPPSAY